MIVLFEYTLFGTKSRSINNGQNRIDRFKIEAIFIFVYTNLAVKYKAIKEIVYISSGRGYLVKPSTKLLNQLIHGFLRNYPNCLDSMPRGFLILVLTLK